MYPVLGLCPVCQEPLTITRLHCRACDTTIDGQFYVGRLAQLSKDHLQFVEVFLQCEGKIKAVEEKLGISYPTVRARLRDVLRSMGYEPSDSIEQPPEVDRHQILDDLATGKITSDEAIELLKA